MEDHVRFALEKLSGASHEDSSQGRSVSNFTFPWWNVELHGGYDPTDLNNVDPHIGGGMPLIFTFLAREEDVVCLHNYRSEMVQIRTHGRRQKVETA